SSSIPLRRASPIAAGLSTSAALPYHAAAYPREPSLVPMKKTSSRNTSDEALAALAARVGRHLLESGRQLATAESCPGGWISKALTDIAGSSGWLTEGFVTYSNEAKM